MVGDVERTARALLDHDDGHAAVGGIAQRGEQTIDDERREAERHLVREHELGLAAERARRE